MAERALVTGGAGFIGLPLCRRLLADGYEVTVLDNLSRQGMDREFAELIGDIQFIDHDLSLGVPDVVPSHCSLVMHLAGWVGVSRVCSNPYRVLRDNIASTLSIFEWCGAHDVNTIFLSSTSEIADGATELGLADFPVKENTPFALPRPHAARSSYALSKVVAEALLMFTSPGHPRVRIGRFYNVYGPRMGSAHVIPQFIERLLARIDPFPVYGGDHTRAFCYVSDAVEATLRLVALPTDEPAMVNIGNDQEEIAMIELAHRLFAVAGFSSPLDIRAAPPGSPLRRLPDLSALRELTSYEPAVELDHGLALTYDWYARRTATEDLR